MAQEKNSSKVDPMQVALLNESDFSRRIIFVFTLIFTEQGLFDYFVVR